MNKQIKKQRKYRRWGQKQQTVQWTPTIIPHSPALRSHSLTKNSGATTWYAPPTYIRVTASILYCTISILYITLPLVSEHGLHGLEARQRGHSTAVQGAPPPNERSSLRPPPLSCCTRRLLPFTPSHWLSSIQFRSWWIPLCFWPNPCCYPPPSYSNQPNSS